MTDNANEWKPDHRDLTLITYLARGATYAQAAQAASVSESTAYRRARAPGFAEALAAERAAIRRRTADQLAAMTGKALQALTDLLDSPNDPTRLAAVRLVIEGGLKYADAVILAEEIAEIRDAVTALQAEQGTGRGPTIMGRAA